MADQSNIQSAASKSIRPFKSSEEYLYAMKEDLAEWLNTLYDLDVTADTFMDGLETGCALCRHANNVNRAAHDFQQKYPEAAQTMKVPSKDVVFQSRNVVPGSFLARDNVSNFITWCRQELWIKDVLMFETNDLVERSNEKNFILCLLEVARRGSKFGMLAPMLIQLEEEIEEEIRDQESLQVDGEESTEQSSPSRCYSWKESCPSVQDEEEEPEPEPFIWPQKRILCDMRNLDELVREILGKCSCPAQFPMIKVSEGKYKVGDSSALIFIRVLRTHVMVRVGGGWDTLEHYLDKHDPCRCAAFAHRYHQAKASGQGQGAHSKSSSAHSSRSTSPGPHWRNDGIAPYKPPDRRTLELLCAQSASSSPSTRPSRSQKSSVPSELDSSPARTLMPRPPRDRSEPRHFNPLRNKEGGMPVTRRLSGDSDSSTASSKGGGGCGGGGGGGGGRHSLGGPSRRTGEEVVLLVNRKEGKHMIERSGTGAPRARSQSRERATLTPALKPSPSSGSPGGTRKFSAERGRSLASEGSRRLSAPRSHSQSKLTSRAWSCDSSPGSSCKDPHPPSSDRSEELPSRQVPSSNSIVGGLSKKQSSSCSNSPVKGGQISNNSPSKKTTNTPRPPAPHSPSLGRGKLLPPVNSGARRSPHSSTQTSIHPGARSPRISHTPRTAARAPHRKLSGLEQQEPEEEGLGFGFQMLPTLDPQKEQDLYRTFEAEFLANTQQARGVSVGKASGGAKQQVKHSASRHSDPNITDSAYSSSNSSTSSTTVGVKTGSLPELKESKRTNLHHFPLDDPLNLLYGHHFGGSNGNGQGETQHWGDSRGSFKKLPAISSSMEGRESPDSTPDLGDTEPDGLRNHISSQPAFHCKTMNGDHEGCPTSVKSQQAQQSWDAHTNRDVKLENDHPNVPYEIENGGQSVEPPPPEPCQFLVPFHPSEDGSFQDSSSENSSMGLSLSGSRSGSPPLSSMVNGESRQKKTNKGGPNSKHSQGVRFRPRIDNRPENSPSRIPTPVSYRDLHSRDALSPSHSPPLSPHSSHSGGRPTTCKNLHQAFTDMIHPQSCSPALGSTDCSYTAHSGSLDTEAWM